MPFSTAAKNTMLDALDESAATGADYMSLHSAYSAAGGSELTGGSPAYARKACAWNAASSGTKALASNVAFDVPAASTVAFVGLWDALTEGTFLGMMPAGSAAAKPFAMNDTTADTFKCAGHGFSNGDTVVFWGSDIPTDLTAGTVYYVINANTNDFQVSTTSGGGAVAITDAGNGFVQKIVREVFAAQGTYTVTATGTSMDLSMV